MHTYSSQNWKLSFPIVSKHYLVFAFFLLFIFGSQAQCILLDAGSDQTIDCDNPEVQLDITINGLPELILPNTGTETYRIEIPSCPLPALTGDPTNINVDDTFSGILPIDFDFSFYGNTYTEYVVGANGRIAFDTSLANGFDNWSFEPNELLPFEDGSSFFFNMIYGAYHDIHPGIGGDINFFVSGTAPERALVVNFNAVPHFSCGVGTETTQQIILYESTNIIQVNLIEKPICAQWNDGLAVLGIQGNDLTEFAVPPDRNTGAWEATDESWYFIPDGAPNANSTFEVINLNTGAVVATSLPVTVSPNETTTYNAVLTFDLPNGTSTTIEDSVIVTFEGGTFDVDLGDDQDLCGETSYDITATLDGADPADATFLWSTGETTQTITVTASDTYSVEVTVDSCTVGESVEVIFSVEPDIELGADIVECIIEGVQLDATPSNIDPNDVTFEWSLNGNVLPSETGPTLNVSAFGVYRVVVANGDCISTDDVSVLLASDILIELGDDIETCFDNVIELDASPSNYDPAIASYEWSRDGTVLPDEQTPILVVVESGTYSVVVTIGQCEATDSVTISGRDDLVVEIQEEDFRTCPNEPQSLSAITDETDVDFQWLLNGDEIAGATSSTLEVSISESSVGEQIYTVVISVGDCTGQDEVGITLYDVDNCTISEGLSPNGDGRNDQLDLEFLADRTDGLSLEVFNRQGRSVFEMDNYVNEFEGLDSNGNELPTGTYFYVIKFKSTDTVYGDLQTGNIYINRDEN